MKSLATHAALWATLLLSGCNGVDFKTWVAETGKLKTASLDQAKTVPYRQDQHKAFKAYFSQLGGMALTLKDDTKLKEGFNEAFGKSVPAELCKSILMPRADWVEISRNCQKNEFFLCAEEVRAYPEMVTALRAGLNPDQQRRFDSADACRSVLGRR